MIVIDASMALASFFEDERTPPVVAAMDAIAASGAIVPALWRLEVANGFRMAIRRGRIDSAFRDRSLAKLAALPVEIDDETDAQAWGAIVALSDKHGLTTYDAAYLELAQRRRIPLATLDNLLRTAAVQAGIASLSTTQ